MVKERSKIRYRESERGEAPPHPNLPLSFEGEGDKGVEVDRRW